SAPPARASATAPPSARSAAPPHRPRPSPPYRPAPPPPARAAPRRCNRTGGTGRRSADRGGRRNPRSRTAAPRATRVGRAPLPRRPDAFDGTETDDLGRGPGDEADPRMILRRPLHQAEERLVMDPVAVAMGRDVGIVAGGIPAEIERVQRQAAAFGGRLDPFG